MSVTVSALLPFAVSYAAVTAIPGPNFMVVADAGLSSRRSSALLAAAGVATGAMLLAAVMATSTAPLAEHHVLRVVASAFFCLLLIVIGYRAVARSLRSERRIVTTSQGTPWRRFLSGLLTAVSNPTTAVFFASAALHVDDAVPTLALPIVVFAIAAAWFGCVGLAMTVPVVRLAHARHWRLIDGTAGAVLISLGLLSIRSI